MKHALSTAEAAERVTDGATVHIGGIMGVVSPHRVIDALVASVTELISGADAPQGQGAGTSARADRIDR